MKLLTNKVAIITGASSGIGYATAKLFAKEGAKLVLTSRREKELSLLVSDIVESGGKVVSLLGDVEDESLSKNLVELAINTFGSLDIAFNNAGTLGSLGATSDMELSNWFNTVISDRTCNR